MPRTLLLLILLTGAGAELGAQTVYFTRYAHQADLKVYVVTYPHRADLLVIRCRYPHQADGNRGRWFETRYPHQARIRLYRVKYAHRADLLICYVRYPHQARWRNKEKKALLDRFLSGTEKPGPIAGSPPPDGQHVQVIRLLTPKFITQSVDECPPQSSFNFRPQCQVP